ncbi:GAF and ANTAR domain-containing protein [Kribbella qitaiheensis]|uniref:GAF and ANTAR domain-containing protein n=1 Tax=Kribbella qitaiheensis TaxID=1544730 RepID=A0A7G6WS69_9ACTN|nr:GAF and ANTAR domain-containing protein [Kribbella qitaiheensis]QNE16834.1 GAF and ANTAR domain-containing protein [Kribbella qitaiheensis]
MFNHRELTAADIFARLAVDLHAAGGIGETVEAVAKFAVHALGCSSASVVLIRRGRSPEVAAVTDEALAELYRRQIDTGNGPLITAVKDDVVVMVADVLTDDRWTAEWAAQVAAAGIRSALHLPLPVAGRPVGVLSVYSDAANGFSDDDLAVAHILARHASIAVATRRQQDTLGQAVDARKLVGVAMGILMISYDVDQARAFTILQRYSQDTNTKLRDVAQHVIDTRKLPNGRLPT